MMRTAKALREILAGIMVIAVSGIFPVAGAQTFKNSFTDPPPPGWTGPVFKLSQKYPATLPGLEPLSKRPWR